MRHLFAASAVILSLTLGGPEAWASDDRADDSHPDPARSLADEHLKREVTSWLKGLHGTASDARSFVADQAPHVVRELIVVGRVERSLLMVGLLGMVGFGQWTVRRVFRTNWSEAINDPELGPVLRFFLGSLSIGATIILLVVAVHNVHGFVTAWFAPRIYVMEYIAGLLGKASGG